MAASSYTLIRQNSRGEIRNTGLTKAKARMFAHMFLVDNGCGTRADMLPFAERAANGERVEVAHPAGGTYVVQISR